MDKLSRIELIRRVLVEVAAYIKSDIKKKRGFIISAFRKSS
jgi:hypothetical protein